MSAELAAAVLALDTLASGQHRGQRDLITPIRVALQRLAALEFERDRLAFEIAVDPATSNLPAELRCALEGFQREITRLGVLAGEQRDRMDRFRSAVIALLADLERRPLPPSTPGESR